MILSILLVSASPCAAASRILGVAQRACYGRLAQQTDREMAAQWQFTLRTLRQRDKQNRREKANKPDLASSLLNSQRAWIRYRNAHCEVVSNQWAGGTGFGEIASRCEIQLNRQRTSDLKRLAEGNLNPPYWE